MTPPDFVFEIFDLGSIRGGLLFSPPDLKIEKISVRGINYKGGGPPFIPGIGFLGGESCGLGVALARAMARVS